MHLVLKAAFTLCSVLAITNVTAQCGPRGCGVQRGYSGGNDYPASYSDNYSAGYSNPGYYDQYGQQYHGWEDNQYPAHYQQGRGYQGGNYNQNWNQHGGGHMGWDQDSNERSGWDRQGGGQYHQDFNNQQHLSGGQNQPYSQSGAYDTAHGYDQPKSDHPVTDHSGQPIRYYGKPGPDYNNSGSRPNTPPANNNPTAAQRANYNYSSANNNWNNLADADEVNGAHDLDHTPHGGGTSKAPTTKPAIPNDSDSKPASGSKW